MESKLSTLWQAYMMAADANPDLQREKFLDTARNCIARGELRASGLKYRADNLRSLKIDSYNLEAIPPLAMTDNKLSLVGIGDSPDEARLLLFRLCHLEEFGPFRNYVGVVHRVSWNQKDELRGWAYVHLMAEDVDRFWRGQSTRAPEATAELTSGRPSRDEVVNFLREEISRNGGFISQDSAARITREKFPQVKRDIVRCLVKELTGNIKTGPRGGKK